MVDSLSQGTHDQSATARLVRELGWPVVAVESVDSVRLNEVAQRAPHLLARRRPSHIETGNLRF